MAEEIIYDQIEQGNDPDPLGLRRQLKNIKQAPKVDPLGLRTQLNVSKMPQQPVFQVNIAEPTFREKQQSSDLHASAVSQPINIRKEEINYIPDERAIEVEKLRGKAQAAQKKLNIELLSNDDKHEKKIREYRRDNYNIENLRNDYKEAGQILAPQDEKRILQREKQRLYEMPVTAEEISDIKTGTVLNEANARKFIKELNKKDANAGAYSIRAYNELSNDPDALERIQKVKNNIKGIEKGHLVYDPETDNLIRPVGLIGSAIESVKQKNQLYADRDFLKNTENDAAILSEYKARKKDQQDDPIVVPKGKLSEIVGGLAGTPWQTFAAGALGSLGGPQAGIAAATIVGGRESAKLEYPATFWRTLDEMISQGIPEFEAVQKARGQADNAAEVGAITGGLSGLVGAKMGMGITPKINFSPGFKSAAFNVLKNYGYDIGKAGLEGLATGGVGVAGEVYKNKLAQEAGINRELDEGTKEVFEQNLITTVALAAAIKGFRGVTGPKARQLMHGLSKLPDDQIHEMLAEKVNNGEITQKAADETQQSINDYKEKDSQIPPNVTEEARFKIQDNIDKINQLEAQKEATHKSLQEPIKEKIQELTGQNIALAKEVDKPAKIETGLTKKQENEATELANEWLVEGIFPDTYEGAIKSDPIGFWREIAQQAQNRDANWKPLNTEDAALSEQAVRDQFGDTVVDYAKELFPAPNHDVMLLEENKRLDLGYIDKDIAALDKNNPMYEQRLAKYEAQRRDIESYYDIRIEETKNGGASKEAKTRVSVIKPGEIKHPETITIKPKEDAIPVGSAEEIPLDETPGISPEMVEGIPESGETAIPQERQITIEEGNVEGQKEINEPREIGITHRQMDDIAREFGFDTYDKSPERIVEWDEQAAKAIANNPNALPNLFEKLRNGQAPDPVETRMMVQYMGDLMAKIDKNPADAELLIQLKRTKDLFNIAGRIQGKQLAARKGTVGAEERLGDFLINDMEANRAPLTKDQAQQAIREFEEIKAAKDALSDKVASLELENTKLKAKKELEKVSKSTKKSGKRDFRAERDEILKEMKKKWDDSKGQLSSTFIPYADRLVKIAPEAAKLIKVLVEEGIDKLPDLVKSAHGHLKNIIPDITEKDVHDLIAGEYIKSKTTKNELSEKLYDLRTEAKLINRLEKLEAGEEPRSERAKIKRSQEIENLKQQIKEHDLTKLAAHKSRIERDISKVQEQLRSGNFSTEKKPEIKLDDEAIALKDQLIKLKQEREKRLAKLEYENRTQFEKAKDVATNVLNIPRTLMASADLSAPLRQGIVATVAHPGVAAKAFPEMLRQAFSQKQFDRWLVELKESPEYKLMEDSGLYIADPNDLRLQVKEEQFMSNLGEKIPLVGRIVKGSERGYVAYLNKMRADLFTQGAEIFADQGRTFENSPELYKGLATFINNATGRGGLGPLEQSAQILNTAFFSPRLIASRLNMINPVFYTKLPKEVRIMALKDMSKLILFGSSILGLASMAGAQVEKDPRSSDFGKIRVGNTRWDIWGGFQQYARIFAQLLSGETKSSNTGQIYELKGDKFPYKTRLDQLGSFFRGKLAPVPGTAIDLLAGKNVVGEQFDPAKKAYELFVPMIIQDIREAWKEQGPKSILTVGVPSALGIGTTTYEQKPSESKSKTNIHKSPRGKQNKKLHNKTH